MRIDQIGCYGYASSDTCAKLESYFVSLRESEPQKKRARKKGMVASGNISDSVIKSVYLSWSYVLSANRAYSDSSSSIAWHDWVLDSERKWRSNKWSGEEMKCACLGNFSASKKRARERETSQNKRKLHGSRRTIRCTMPPQRGRKPYIDAPHYERGDEHEASNDVLVRHQPDTCSNCSLWPVVNETFAGPCIVLDPVALVLSTINICQNKSGSRQKANNSNRIRCLFRMLTQRRDSTEQTNRDGIALANVKSFPRSHLRWEVSKSENPNYPYDSELFDTICIHF
uniref:Uncharacterized protein n=1 Tax=Trichogramma kaykai TaxID=54128 RepID=A0ABD2VSE9_9HYME